MRVACTLGCTDTLARTPVCARARAIEANVDRAEYYVNPRFEYTVYFTLNSRLVDVKSPSRLLGRNCRQRGVILSFLNINISKLTSRIKRINFALHTSSFIYIYTHVRKKILFLSIFIHGLFTTAILLHDSHIRILMILWTIKVSIFYQRTPLAVTLQLAPFLDACMCCGKLTFSLSLFLFRSF